MSKETGKFIPEEAVVLFIDIGNSSIKAAYKEGINWKGLSRFGLQNAADLVRWIASHPFQFDFVVISSVVNNVADALTQNLGNMGHKILTISDIPPTLLDYETPETLGMDRFFACYGAVVHTKTPAVVIDAGTACTMDFMTADYIYRGGVIMPGLSIIEKALRTYAPALPEVERELPAQWPGRSTVSCLKWGITGTFIEGIHGMLRRFENQLDSYQLFITGGDAEWLAAHIGRDTKIRPMLVFEGMERFFKDYR